MIEKELLVPQNDGSVLVALETGAVIATREYVGQDVLMRIIGAASLLGRYRAYWIVAGSKDVGKSETGRKTGSGDDSQIRSPSDPEPGRGDTL